MYSKLIERVQKLTWRQTKDKPDELRPREIINRAVRDDINLSYAQRIVDAYFPEEALDDVFVRDEPNVGHLTTAEVIRIVEANPYYGEILPDAVFNPIFKHVNDHLCPVTFNTSTCAMMAWAYVAGIAEGVKTTQNGKKPGKRRVKIS